MSDDSSNPERPNPRTLPGWLIAVIALVATVFLFFFAEFIGSLLIGLGALMASRLGFGNAVALTNSLLAQFLFGLLADGLLVAGVIYMLHWFHWDLQTIGLKQPRPRNLFIGIVAVVPYYIFYLGLALGIKALIPGLNFDQTQDIGFNGVQGLLPLAVTFVSLVILPPLAEEITMRGFLYTGLRQWLPRLVAGLLVSILFGMAHLMEGGASGPLWIGAIDTFSLSMVLILLREKTGNLWAGVVLHATKNLIAFLSLFIISGR